VDDFGVLTPAAKLAGQAVAVFVLLRSGVVIELVEVPQGLRWPLAAIWLFGVCNAFNLLDVMDGLAAGVGAIAALALGVVALSTGEYPEAAASFALAGALAGLKAPVLGCALAGDDVHQLRPLRHAVAVIGSEGQGLSAAVRRQVQRHPFAHRLRHRILGREYAAGAFTGEEEPLGLLDGSDDAGGLSRLEVAEDRRGLHHFTHKRVLRVLRLIIHDESPRLLSIEFEVGKPGLPRHGAQQGTQVVHEFGGHEISFLVDVVAGHGPGFHGYIVKVGRAGAARVLLARFTDQGEQHQHCQQCRYRAYYD
jgi:hypothetical protein